MSVTRSLLLLVGGGLLALVILKVSISTFAKSQITAGCPSYSVTGLVDPTETVAIWQDNTLAALTALNSTLEPIQQAVLGESNTDNKWIEVDLTRQKLTAHQGTEVFLESPISSGLWNRTPTGEYRIWYKIRSTKMEGGSRMNNTYYYLPNVPYSMFFNGDFGIHGTYWHNNFGRPMSHGCVNTPTPVAEKLYYWTGPVLPAGKNMVRATDDNPGTRVVIHY